MRERDVERKLCEGIKRLGGKAYKFVSPGNDGVPDRIIVLPNGRVIFVELKADCGRLSPLQGAQVDRLRGLNCDVRVLRGVGAVEEFLSEVGV